MLSAQVIQPRLRSMGNSYANATFRHADDYAVTGLRTLILTATELEHEVYHNWNVR